jgi:hypothetical protein
MINFAASTIGSEASNMELLATLELWQILLLIPVALGIGAAIIFALGWVFLFIFLIAFKLAIFALGVGAVLFIMYLFESGVIQ